jgi:tetratricopeptide (TPR) repeat protein
MSRWIIAGITAALVVGFTIWWWIPGLDANVPFIETFCGSLQCSFAERASIYGGLMALLAIAFTLYFFLTSEGRTPRRKDGTSQTRTGRTGDIRDSNVGNVEGAVSGSGAVGVVVGAQGSPIVTGEHATVNVGSPQPDAASHPDSALHQLREPVADFTGREDALGRLLREVGESGVTISGVQGMGGIGKTELALVLAHEIAPDHTDAQIFLDLRGASNEPATVSEAMSHVIRAFDTKARIPQDEAGLAALYHSTLRGKRALLLMDNASGAEQVQPLIPPSGCLLLVTSRFRFTLPGMHTENLSVMSEEDARDLLLSIALRIGDHADAIAELCGRLPQALRLAGSALKVREDLTPEAYIGRLQDTPTRFQELDKAYASIATSYELLSGESQRRFRMLAVFPETFDVGGAAAVWELEGDQAQDTLSDLRTYSLLDWSAPTSRYHLHDLVRDFAASQLDDDESEGARLRHSSHYVEVLARADRLYRDGGDSTLPGLGLFDADIENIRTGQRWAADNRDGDSAATELCSRYASAGPSIFLIRLHLAERILWLEAGLQAARTLGHRRAEAVHLGNLGTAYFSVAEYRMAIEHQERSLAIERELGSRLGEGQSLGNLGNAYYALGEYDEAIKYHQRSLAILRELGNRLGEGQSLGSLGLAFHGLGEYHKAIRYHEQHLAIAKEFGDRMGEGQSTGNLGNAYNALEEYDKAIDYYEKQLWIAREIGDRIGEANGLFNMSTSLHARGDREAATERMEEALAIFEAMEVPEAERARNSLSELRGEA